VKGLTWAQIGGGGLVVDEYAWPVAIAVAVVASVLLGLCSASRAKRVGLDWERGCESPAGGGQVVPDGDLFDRVGGLTDAQRAAVLCWLVVAAPMVVRDALAAISLGGISGELGGDEL
jgi:hypothetical protein